MRMASFTRTIPKRFARAISSPALRIGVGFGVTATAASLAGSAFGFPSFARGEETKIIVGTYTQKLGHVDGKGRGLYSFDLDPYSGALNFESTFSDAGENPTYLCRNGDMLYVVNELYEDDGDVTVYRIATDKDSGKLTLEKGNSCSALGGGTCHVSTTPNRTFVAVANYDGGERSEKRSGSSLAVYHLHPDGRIGDLAAALTHKGKGTNGNPARQGEPHAHMAYVEACGPDHKDGYAVLTPDLGLDQVKQYFLSPNGVLLPHPGRESVSHAAGSGPRHMVDGEVTDKDTSIAAIRAHPSGKFVYVSNRVVGGEGIITVFRVEDESGEASSPSHGGRLQASSYHKTGGATPRDFTLLKDNGSLMIVANQDSDNLVTFKVNGETGALLPTGKVAHCPSPVAIVSVPQ
eukprot:jgi/Bigna1/85733/estExt_fgenesh1_pg.C_50375